MRRDLCQIFIIYLNHALFQFYEKIPAAMSRFTLGGKNVNPQTSCTDQTNYLVENIFIKCFSLNVGANICFFKPPLRASLKEGAFNIKEFI